MTEDELINKVKANDFGAFNLLVKKYERLVFSIILKVVQVDEDVEDIAQEVFIKVYKKINTYRFDSSFATWIGRIAYNLAINHIKKHKQLFVNDANFEIDRNNQIHSPEETLMQKEKSSFIQEQIKSLPSKYRVVLSLYHLNEMSYKEISSITQTTESSVKTNIFRARKMLKDKLKEYLKL